MTAPAPATLRAGTASKGTCCYDMKYVTKATVDISVCAPLLADAHKSIHDYPSVAEDRAQNLAERTAKHYAQRVINHSGMEFEASQAANVVLRLSSSHKTDHSE